MCADVGSVGWARCSECSGLGVQHPRRMHAAIAGPMCCNPVRVGLFTRAEFPFISRSAQLPRDVFDRSAATCVAVGWDYLRVGSLDPVLRANLRWLSGYRHPRVLRFDLADHLAEVFARVHPLMAGVHAVGTPLVVLPVLFHLLWHGRLVADLQRATLCDDTAIGLGAGW